MTSYSHFEVCSGAGNNLGTIRPEYPAKRTTWTEEEAKRANKIHDLNLSTKQGVGCSNHPGRTKPLNVMSKSPARHQSSTGILPITAPMDQGATATEAEALPEIE